MPGRARRRAGSAELAGDEGPFASFTDLFIGILFLFLILVAALMLMNQDAVRKEKVETIQPVQPKPDAAPKRPPDQPAFRLGIVFNIYQRPAVFDGSGWTYSRTVRVFRAPTGDCINTVWLRSNLSTAWMPPVGADTIPTEAQRDVLRSFQPCGISASGDHWDGPTETGALKRVTPELYSGTVTLHEKEGDVKLEMQYRVLGVYDDYFR
ncbi:hypothetical protein [Phenylobacterium sp.]|uniref:hypothetical protein n=1 Tax=Phenylobacterium sp. TaxID=1871053 RepID=UPI0012103CB3|nr:hypothetical protein [Phenylobacterium sp.]THD72135.1 MAG: hypothetical protein E8A12_00995 [Phenylobacterium sp.]